MRQWPPGSHCTGWPISGRTEPGGHRYAGCVSQPPPPPAYGYGPPQPRPQTSSDAVAALVLSILSWAVCPLILAIVALIFASKASKAIAASNGWLEGSGMVTAARIISWLNIALGILFLGFFIVALIIGAFSTSVPTDTGDLDAVLRLF